MEEPEQKSSLDEIKDKLYSKHYKPIHRREKLSDKKYNIDNDWDPNNNDGNTTSDTKEKPQGKYWGPGSNEDGTAMNSSNKKGTFLLLLFIAMGFFLGSLVYAYFVFMGGSKNVTVDDVTINIAGPVSIGGGEPLSLDVIIQNNNTVNLELVDLVVSYPVGTKDPIDLRSDLKVERIPLRDIQAGAIVRKTINSALFGEENSLKEIEVSIQYRLQGSNAIFEKNKPFEIVLTTSPVRLVIDGLKEISSNQEIELTATLTSNSTKKLQNVMVRVKYPFGFNYESASIEPFVEDNIWFFDELDPEEERKIVISGSISGQDNEERVFRFNTGIQSEENSDELGIVWNTVLHETEIKRAFVDLNIAINNTNNENYIVQSGSKLSGIVSFINRTDSILRDIEIDLSLDDNQVIEKSGIIVEKGFYNSNSNKISWNSESNNIFNELKPDQELKLSFQVDLKNFSDGEFLNKDPNINLDAIVKAIRISDDDVEDVINTNTFANIKIISDVMVDISTLHNSGPLANIGPIPPKAGDETSYTLIYDLSNTVNDLEDVKVESILPSYVSWNSIFNPNNERIVYNDETRSFIWYAGDVPARTGFSTPPKRLYVSVTLNPSISQIGSSPNLLREAKITGFDTFTESNFVQNLEFPNTVLKDRGLGDRHEVVTE